LRPSLIGAPQVGKGVTRTRLDRHFMYEHTPPRLVRSPFKAVLLDKLLPRAVPHVAVFKNRQNCLQICTVGQRQTPSYCLPRHANNRSQGPGAAAVHPRRLRKPCSSAACPVGHGFLCEAAKDSTFPDCLLTMYRCARTQSPHPTSEYSWKHKWVKQRAASSGTRRATQITVLPVG